MKKALALLITLSSFTQTTMAFDYPWYPKQNNIKEEPQNEAEEDEIHAEISLFLLAVLVNLWFQKD